MEVTRPDVVTELVEAALLVEPAAYARPQTRRRYLQNEVVPEVTEADEIARELRASLDRADRIRRSLTVNLPGVRRPLDHPGEGLRRAWRARSPTPEAARRPPRPGSTG